MKSISDFKKEVFTFADRKGVIVYPDCEPVGRILLKTEYFDAFPSFDIAMLEKGYYLIFIFHQTRWAPDEETHIMADFLKHCAEKLGVPPRCVLEGMSCGGLQALRFAQLYPHLAGVLYIDAPVVNILSMAGLGAIDCDDKEKFWSEIQAAYGVDRTTIVNFRKSPIDFFDKLIDNDIPIIMLYGTLDTVVVYEENGKVLKDYYDEHGGIIEVIAREGGGHHPHSLDDPSVIVEFVEKHI